MKLDISGTAHDGDPQHVLADGRRAADSRTVPRSETRSPSSSSMPEARAGTAARRTWAGR